jgi:hypothetical protein
MGLIIGGIVCLLIGMGTFLLSRYERAKYESIVLAHPAQAGQLQEMGAEIATAVGSGNWRDYVKVSGMVQCAEPLRSDFSQSACVYFSAVITREYEEEIITTDKDGHQVRNNQRRSETISSNNRSIPFQIQDSTGVITVNPHGASVESIQTINEFRPNQPRDGILRFENFALTLGDRQFSPTTTTLGYRYQELIVPVEHHVFVLAAVSDASGEPILLKPSNSRYKFLISTKPETEVSENARQSANVTWYGSLFFGGVGLVLVIMGIIGR